ncbi:hypothetical protein RND71_036769 [Anisodus tanguticus]|uniref:Uncharacterized protein n=1 Tax=Anisodus tanguticus TaxID=243964 RepID=A0AAE1V0M3_9SOLA|nr:hypothetical protein RND71_036769 [Anisodus tanguticus]
MGQKVKFTNETTIHRGFSEKITLIGFEFGGKFNRRRYRLFVKAIELGENI